MNRETGFAPTLPRAEEGMPQLPAARQCAPQQARPDWRRSITRLQEPSATIAFKQKMATEEAKQIYARRSQIAEFPHAWIKERCGLRQFRCRGRVKAAMEATWACLSYNLARWFSLKRTPASTSSVGSFQRSRQKMRGCEYVGTRSPSSIWCPSSRLSGKAISSQLPNGMFPSFVGRQTEPSPGCLTNLRQLN